MTELTLQQANGIIEAVLRAARERAMPPIAVAVLDSGAHLKALQREDGVSFLRTDIAQAKAWGALAMACNTDQLAARYSQDDLQKGFIDSLNAMTGGRIIPLPGAGGCRHTLKQTRHGGGFQCDRQHAVLETVIEKNIRKTRCDHHPKTLIKQGPYRVFT